MIRTSNKEIVQILLQHCILHEIKNIIVSPGSRNSPLVIAFNQHPFFKCIAVPDERSAAFIGLGMYHETKKPSVLVCTSGSAPLNYYPAVSEAYYQNIPLLVITADRPEEWVNQGDGQTIVQNNVYQNHINYFVQLSDTKYNKNEIWEANRELSVAFSSCIYQKKGPVHVNIALSEPLYGTIELKELPDIQTFQTDFVKTELRKNALNTLELIWKNSPKKLVICGQLEKNSVLQDLLVQLSADSSVLIMVENISNVSHPNFVTCIDRLLNSIDVNENEKFRPDLLITIGGAIVSKKIKTFLRENKAKHCWKIGKNFPNMDTFQQLTHTFDIEDINFLKNILNFDKENYPFRYGNYWKEKDYLIQEKHQQFFNKETKLSDITAYQIILDSVPEFSNLHLSNSSVIRYSQLFDSIKDINYLCNRGTSGIDGSTSTSIGTAFANDKKLNVLISGDISFFYDSNAFWNHLKPTNLKIFYINNGGGSIFKIIPGPDTTEELNEFFVFDNQFSVEKLCTLYNIQYYYSDSLEKLDQQMLDFFTNTNGISLFEIDTRKVKNEDELKKYFQFVKV